MTMMTRMKPPYYRVHLNTTYETFNLYLDAEHWCKTNSGDAWSTGDHTCLPDQRMRFEFRFRRLDDAALFKLFWG